ncbi:MAG: response regulator, partial [Chloroflexota bacterium]
DDDPVVGDLLNVVLEDEGYRVVLAQSAEEAWQRVAEQPPCLVLLDLMIPRVDGFAIGDSLRAAAETASIPLVVLSASRRMQCQDDIKRLAPLDYLDKPFDDKPFDLNVLGERVRGWLERAPTGPVEVAG